MVLMMSALLDDNSVILTDFQHEAIKQLKETINHDYPSINIQEDINFLTTYLYANDWNVQDALAKIVQNFRIKKQSQAWFPAKKVSEYLPVIRRHSRYMLVDRDKNGKRIFVYKAGNFNIPEMNLRLSAQLDDMWYDAMLMDRCTQKNGLTVIVDCKNLPKSMIKWLIPKDIKVSSDRTNIFPCKNLAVHLVNISALLHVFSKAIMPLLNESVRRKFHFHQNDWKLLHEIVGKDCLPEEYGGPPGKIVEYEKAYKFLLDKESILEEHMKFGI